MFQLFEIKFNDYYVNQDKYRKVIYNSTTNTVTFESLNKNAQLVNIKFKNNYDYSIEIKDDLSITIDNEYDYNLIYLVDNNPVIKSGFIFIDNKNKALAHSITLEEVE